MWTERSPGLKKWACRFCWTFMAARVERAARRLVAADAGLMAPRARAVGGGNSGDLRRPFEL